MRFLFAIYSIYFFNVFLLISYLFITVDAPTQTDLEVFYGQKGKMLTEHWITEDYLERIKEEANKLDEIRRELDKLQEV